MGRPDEARAWHSLVLAAEPGNTISRAAVERLEGTLTADAILSEALA